MHAEIWFYEDDPENADPVLVKRLGPLPRAERERMDWKCGDTIFGDATVAELWGSVADTLGLVLAKLAEV